TPQASYYPLSARTDADWPLLFVPVGDGLQVWRHDDTWHPAQFLAHTLDAEMTASVDNPGYTRTFVLSANVSDFNSDGRDDLMVLRHGAAGAQEYALYLQLANGAFTPEPVMTFTNQSNSRSALCWVDLNRDGRPDLVRCEASEE